MAALDAAVVCPLCLQGFPNEEALAEHCGGLLPEPDDEPYFCACGAGFCSPVALASHCEATGHTAEEAVQYDESVLDGV